MLDSLPNHHPLWLYTRQEKQKLAVIMKKVLILLLSILFSQSSNAQKVAYVDFNTILTKMPAYQSAESKLLQYQAHLKDSLNEATTQYEHFRNRCVNKSETGYYTTRPSEKDADIKKLNSLEKSLETLQNNLEALLDRKQIELIQPIEIKLIGIIETYAKENGYSYIFMLNSALYSQKTVPDISEQIMQKMGL